MVDVNALLTKLGVKSDADEVDVITTPAPSESVVEIDEIISAPRKRNSIEDRARRTLSKIGLCLSERDEDASEREAPTKPLTYIERQAEHYRLSGINRSWR